MDCYKEECPPLTSCLTKEAERPDPLACCKVCPQKPKKVDKQVKTSSPVLQVDSQKLNDMGRVRSGLDILASGGCAVKGEYHENGESWHPTVMPWGEMKCVSCACKVRNLSFKWNFSSYEILHLHCRTVKLSVRRNIVRL